MGINTFPAASSSGVNYSAGATGSKPGSPTTGQTFYDTTLDILQIWDGASWNNVNNSILAPTWTTASGSLGNAGAGNTFSFTVAATSVYGLAITYTSLDKPAWLTINASTGVLTGTAPAYTGTSDTYSFAISAYDGSNVAQRTFSITVLETVVGRIYVAAGGGSGAAYDNNPNVAVGGGGGGGLLEQEYGLPIGLAIPIVVGAGGAALSYISPVNSGFGNKGSNSTFDTNTIALGGGGGGNYGGGVNTTYMVGGSGGGRGGGTSGAGAAGTAGQGNAGGGTNHTGQYGAGGGGGAGSAGGESTNGTYASGNGGAGGSAGNVAYGVQLCGGGGGSAQVYNGMGGTNAGNGGYSGNPATSGTANRGGGGGGAYSSYNSGAGGSGVVIVRWLESARGTATATTGSPSYTVDNGYRYYTFNSSGSITL